MAVIPCPPIIPHIFTPYRPSHSPRRHDDHEVIHGPQGPQGAQGIQGPVGPIGCQNSASGHQVSIRHSIPELSALNHLVTAWMEIKRNANDVVATNLADALHGYASALADYLDIEYRDKHPSIEAVTRSMLPQEARVRPEVKSDMKDEAFTWGL